MFTRTYGVEIEALAPPSKTRAWLATKIREGGVHCYDGGFGPADQHHWKVVSDSSIVGGNGMEIKSPPLSGEEGLAQVRIVCATLSGLGFTINSSCGLHVHVDIRGLNNDTLSRLAIDYARHENIIDSLLPRSRRGRGNRYARSIANINLRNVASATSINRLRDIVAGQFGKYVKLNFASYWRYGTVEFRHHSGTVEGTKVENWIKFCLRMVDKAQKGTGPFITEPAPRRRASRQNTKTAVVVALLMRPEGATREEILRATGWPSVSVQQVALQAGVVLRTQRVRQYSRKLRYYAEAAQSGTVEGVRVAPSAAHPSFDNFTASLEMSDQEKAYWVERRQRFASRENRNAGE